MSLTAMSSILIEYLGIHFKDSSIIDILCSGHLSGQQRVLVMPSFEVSVLERPVSVPTGSAVYGNANKMLCYVFG